MTPSTATDRAPPARPPPPGGSARRTVGRPCGSGRTPRCASGWSRSCSGGSTCRMHTRPRSPAYVTERCSCGRSTRSFAARARSGGSSGRWCSPLRSRSLVHCLTGASPRSHRRCLLASLDGERQRVRRREHRAGGELGVGAGRVDRPVEVDLDAAVERRRRGQQLAVGRVRRDARGGVAEQDPQAVVVLTPRDQPVLAAVAQRRPPRPRPRRRARRRARSDPGGPSRGRGDSRACHGRRAGSGSPGAGDARWCRPSRSATWVTAAPKVTVSLRVVQWPEQVRPLGEHDVPRR